MYTRDEEILFHGGAAIADGGSGGLVRFYSMKGAGNTGAPTVSNVNGAMRILLASTSEAQVMHFYERDVLTLDPRSLEYVEFDCYLGANLAANEDVAIGVASAKADTVAGMNYRALFRCSGASNAVLLNTDDNVTENTDLTTGLTMPVGKPGRFRLDFSDNVTSVSEGNSLGRWSSVRASGPNISMDAAGVPNRVQASVGKRVNMSNMIAANGTPNSYLQLYARVGKASGATTPSFFLTRIAYGYKIFSR